MNAKLRKSSIAQPAQQNNRSSTQLNKVATSAANFYNQEGHTTSNFQHKSTVSNVFEMTQKNCAVSKFLTPKAKLSNNMSFETNGVMKFLSSNKMDQLLIDSFSTSRSNVFEPESIPRHTQLKRGNFPKTSKAKTDSDWISLFISLAQEDSSNSITLELLHVTDSRQNRPRHITEMPKHTKYLTQKRNTPALTNQRIKTNESNANLQPKLTENSETNQLKRSTTESLFDFGLIDEKLQLTSYQSLEMHSIKAVTVADRNTNVNDNNNQLQTARKTALSLFEKETSPDFIITAQPKNLEPEEIPPTVKLKQLRPQQPELPQNDITSNPTVQQARLNKLSSAKANQPITKQIDQISTKSKSTMPINTNCTALLLDNGLIFKLTENSVGFTCYENFTRIGPESAYCSDNRRWIPSSPECIGIK